LAVHDNGYLDDGKNGYDAILFDFDGVLADTGAAPLRVLEEDSRAVWDPFELALLSATLHRGLGPADGGAPLAAERVPPLPLDEVMPAYYSKLGMFRSHIETNPPFLTETIAMVRELSKF